MDGSLSLIALLALANEPALLQATSHPIRYHLSTPTDWRNGPGKRWPVLVCVCGADSDFAALLEKFERARGDAPFLLVVPCTFSNTNALIGEHLQRYRRLYDDDEIEQACGTGPFRQVNRRLDWDEAGLLAILDDLKAKNGAADRVVITGFSGGGLLTYRMLAHHPERLTGAAPVCPSFNFWGHGYSAESCPAAEADRAIPVLILTGGRDPLGTYRIAGEYLPPPVYAIPLALLLGAAGGFLVWRWTKNSFRSWALAGAGLLLAVLLLANHWAGLSSQADAAEAMLKQLGHTNVERTADPALWHDPTPKQVITFFREELHSR